MHLAILFSTERDGVESMMLSKLCKRTQIRCQAELKESSKALCEF